MREDYQLAGNAAEVYEEQKVPAMFGPLAEATLGRLPLTEHDSIVDVACGTGIVARTARARLGPRPRIAGVDLNEGMIGVARAAPEGGSSCEWHVCDVGAMPFEDSVFSQVICQQGLQFFPDENAALMEMKRVLMPGGKIALTIWSGPSVLFTALAEALARYVDNSVAARSLAPFNYGGRASLEERLLALGYSGLTKEEFAVDRTIKDPANSLVKEILGNPVGPAVSAKGEAIMQNIVDQVMGAVADYRKGADLIVPQHTHLFQAHVS